MELMGVVLALGLFYGTPMVLILLFIVAFVLYVFFD